MERVVSFDLKTVRFKRLRIARRLRFAHDRAGAVHATNAYFRSIGASCARIEPNPTQPPDAREGFAVPPEAEGRRFA